MLLEFVVCIVIVHCGCDLGMVSLGLCEERKAGKGGGMT